jgi:hypothetical protein
MEFKSFYRLLLIHLVRRYFRTVKPICIHTCMTYISNIPSHYFSSQHIQRQREVPSDMIPMTNCHNSFIPLESHATSTNAYIYKQANVSPFSTLITPLHHFPKLPPHRPKPATLQPPNSTRRKMLTTPLSNQIVLLIVLLPFTHATPLSPCINVGETFKRSPVSASPAFWIIVGPMILVVAWVLFGVACAVGNSGNGKGWMSRVGDGMMMMRRRR